MQVSDSKSIRKLQAEIRKLIREKSSVEKKYEKLKNRHHPSFAWIFHFVDVIYVATIYRIDQLFDQCGINFKVFFIAAAYFGIIFTTRMFFDAYALTFKIENNKNEIPRILLFILYCLGVYMMTLNIASHPTNEHAEINGNSYGTCNRDIAYDNGFGVAFIATRILLISLYTYHYFKPNKKVRANSKAYTQLVLKKIIPMSLSSLAMCAIFTGQPPVAVFTVVALIEFLGDIIGEWFTCLPPDLMPDPHDFQERLGLLFMIVLGETMVGVLFQSYNTSRKQRTYATVISAFFIVSSIGMQFFERAQSDPNHDAESQSHQNASSSQHVAAIMSAVNMNTLQLTTSGGGGVGGQNRADVQEVEEGRVNPLSALHNTNNLASDQHRQHSTESSSTNNSSVDSAITPYTASNAHHTSPPADLSHSYFRDSFLSQRLSLVFVMDHPLLLNTSYYAMYVWLHAFISFSMLIATAAIVAIYFNVEGELASTGTESNESAATAADVFFSSSLAHHRFLSSCNGTNTEASSTEQHFSLELEKAMVTGGLVCMWLTMLAMELLQPTYRRSLLAGLRDPDPTGQNRYSKLLFSLKVVVIGLHLMFFFVSDNKGNYFVGLTAVIAGLPSLFDVVKLLKDYVYETPKGLVGGSVDSNKVVGKNERDKTKEEDEDEEGNDL